MRTPLISITTSLLHSFSAKIGDNPFLNVEEIVSLVISLQRTSLSPFWNHNAASTIVFISAYKIFPFRLMVLETFQMCLQVPGVPLGLLDPAGGDLHSSFLTEYHILIQSYQLNCRSWCRASKKVSLVTDEY